MGDGTLAAGLEKEERGPAGGVAEEVRGETTVKGSDGTRGGDELFEEGDSGERCCGSSDAPVN